MARARSPKEEAWNTLTHAIGLLISAAFYASSVSLETRVACSCMMVTYLFSVLYHWTEDAKRKDTFRMLDILSIHVSIGGMSVAYCIMLDAGIYSLLVPAIITAFSCQYVVFNYGKNSFENASALLPTLSGLINLFNVSFVSGFSYPILYFYIGCFIYLLGVLFYINDEKAYFHTIWHVFVVIASTIQIFGTI